MKNIIYIAVFMSTIILACSKSNTEKTKITHASKEASTKPKANATTDNTPTKTTPVTPSVNDAEIKLIAKIKRTPCYGKCPVFSIELYNNGVVKYNGLAFVEKKGNFTAKASAEFIKSIQDKAAAIKYLSLEDKYPTTPTPIADLPTTTTFISLGEVSKQINNNYDAPHELIDFENWLEREFDKLDWKAE